jgi:hypothetical protein
MEPPFAVLPVNLDNSRSLRFCLLMTLGASRLPALTELICCNKLPMEDELP